MFQEPPCSFLSVDAPQLYHKHGQFSFLSVDAPQFYHKHGRFSFLSVDALQLYQKNSQFGDVNENEKEFTIQFYWAFLYQSLEGTLIMQAV